MPASSTLDISDAEAYKQADRPVRSRYILSRKWVESKGKWPYCAQEELQQLMIKHQLFIYHKLDTASNDKLQQLLLGLHDCIDHKGWDTEIHDEMLTIKVLGKLNRIRLEMLENGELIKSGNVYLLSDEDFPLSSQDSLGEFPKAIDKLRREDMDRAMDLIHAAAGGDKFEASIGRWLVQHHPAMLPSVHRGASRCVPP